MTAAVKFNDLEKSSLVMIFFLALKKLYFDSNTFYYEENFIFKLWLFGCYPKVTSAHMTYR